MKLLKLKSTAYLAAFVCLAAPAHANWVRRVTDGIMGTRITVELWADDATFSILRSLRNRSTRCSRKCGISMIR